MTLSWADRDYSAFEDIQKQQTAPLTSWGGYGPTHPMETTTSQPTSPTTPEDTGGQQTLLDDLREILSSSFTSSQVTDLIENIVKPAINRGSNQFEIMELLRGTDTWKAMYPEYQQRIDNGFVPLTEAEIRDRRDQLKEVAQNVWGFTPSIQQMAGLIANDITPDEFQHRLTVFKSIDEHGDAVKAFFAAHGRAIDDNGLYDFFDPTINTSELDEWYKDALYRAAPTKYGFAVRPEEEEKMLREWGVDPETAIANYGQIAGNLPSAERWDAIDRAMGNLEGVPQDAGAALQGVPFMDLFRAVQLGDPKALQRLRDAMTRDKARNTKGGGVGFRGTAAASLLPSGAR